VDPAASEGMSHRKAACCACRMVAAPATGSGSPRARRCALFSFTAREGWSPMCADGRRSVRVACARPRELSVRGVRGAVLDGEQRRPTHLEVARPIGEPFDVVATVRVARRMDRAVASRAAPGWTRADRPRPNDGLAQAQETSSPARASTPRISRLASSLHAVRSLTVPPGAAKDVRPVCFRHPSTDSPGRANRRGRSATANSGRSSATARAERAPFAREPGRSRWRTPRESCFAGDPQVYVPRRTCGNPQAKVSLTLQRPPAARLAHQHRRAPRNSGAPRAERTVTADSARRRARVLVRVAPPANSGETRGLRPPRRAAHGRLRWNEPVSISAFRVHG